MCSLPIECVLLPVHELQVLLLVHVVQERFHTLNGALVAKLLNLRPVPFEDGLLHLLAPLVLLLLRLFGL